MFKPLDGQNQNRKSKNFGINAATTKTILNTNGTAVCTFSVSGSYYLVIKHRNALSTWSSNPVTVGSLPITYAFTTNSAQAYGGNENLIDNVWRIYSGDLNGDENIDLIDLDMLEQGINQFDFGYFATDLNGDGNVDLLDAPLMENNVNSFIYSVHP